MWCRRWRTTSRVEPQPASFLLRPPALSGQPAEQRPEQGLHPPESPTCSSVRPSALWPDSHLSSSPSHSTLFHPYCSTSTGFLSVHFPPLCLSSDPVLPSSPPCFHSCGNRFPFRPLICRLHRPNTHTSLASFFCSHLTSPRVASSHLASLRPPLLLNIVTASLQSLIAILDDDRLDRPINL